MATKLSGSMSAQDAPAIVFTAYQDFVLRLSHTAGASTVALQSDLLDNLDWKTVDTFTTSDTWVVEVPEGCAAKFRLMITTLDTGPVGFAVKGKLNANDTIYEGGGDGAAAGSYVIEESGDDVLAEDGTTKVLEENA
jgi:hypothetical protein